MRRLTRDKSMSNAWGWGYGKEGDPIYTLTTIKDFIPGVLYMEFYENHPNDSSSKFSFSRTSFAVYPEIAQRAIKMNKAEAV